MSKIAIGLFLLVFGVVGLINTKLPEWLVPASALLACVFVLGEGKLKGN